MKYLLFLLQLLTLPWFAQAESVKSFFKDNTTIQIGTESVPAPLILKLYALNKNKTFYFSKDSTSHDLSQQLQALQTWIQLVAEEGLPAKFFWSAEDEQTVNELWSAQRTTELDIFLAWKSLKIARGFSTGITSPENISSEIKLKSESMSESELKSLVQFLKGAFSAEQMKLQLSPNNAVYKNLVRLYKVLQQKTEPESGPMPTKILKKGSKNPAAIKFLKERLSFLGFDASGSDLVVDTELANSIKVFQSAYGLTPDAVVGSKTWTQLSTSLDSLKTQVLLNIDRLRWIPTTLESENIWVNLANQTLTYHLDGNPVMKFLTINGRPDRRTPMMKDSISYAEFNPTWTVPYSIFIKDKLPALQKNPNLIYELKTKVIDDLTGNEVYPDEIDWSYVTPENLHYTLVQTSGAHNALGHVKFPMTNPYSIYLHDTNARQLFSEGQRWLSSGCVRLQNPFELAEALLRDPSTWNVQSMTDFTRYGAPKSTKVAFKRKVPVYLMYTTIELTEQGQIVSYLDNYNIDATHFAAIQRLQAQ
jgi:murein L,D-transpeptidase YcbB/YkuD